MIDKLMSRRCLIEAAAGALLLSGCSSQDESSTKKVKKQDKIKKAEASGETKHLRDKDELYEVYDDSGIVTMYLTVSRGNSSENTDHSWAEINTYSVYDYADMGVTRYQVMGLLQAGDEDGPVAGEVGYGEEAPNATVQVRGQTSSMNSQKNYKVELKKGKGTWRQQRAIALNKHMGEGMRFRNKMAYDLIRGIPQMMGLRTQFVHLWVCDQTEKSNDTFEDYGLFTQVEQLNKTALKAHGLDKSGHLYKVNSFDFHRYEDTIKLADDPDYNQANFEGMLEIKGDTDHTKLIEMLDALNDELQKIDNVLDTYFDTENLVYWLAFQILTGNCDTQNRNCYLYSPLNSNTWYFLDWDNDGMLRKLELSLTGFSDYASWERGASNYWGNVLFNRALRSKAFRGELDRAVKDLRTYLTETRLTKMIKHYREVTESLVFASPDIDNLPVTKDQYEQIAAAIPSEIEDAIGQTVAAYTALSRDKVGALMVFERKTPLDDIIKTGTVLDCSVSSELLKNLFWNKAPLHDGAVIVRNGRIVGAGCVLPLSGNTNLSKDLGMRHRAGIGMSENSDAVVAIVSEETGSISVAVNGMLKRHLAPETLERLMENELVPEQEPAKPSVLANLFKSKKGESDDGETNHGQQGL